MNDLPSPAHATTASVDLSVIRFHINLETTLTYMGRGLVFVSQRVNGKREGQ